MTLSLKIELTYLSSCTLVPVKPSNLLLTSLDLSHELEAPSSGFVRVKVSRTFHNAVVRNVWKVHESYRIQERVADLTFVGI
jgi:hypothetical protein